MLCSFSILLLYCSKLAKYITKQFLKKQIFPLSTLKWTVASAHFPKLHCKHGIRHKERIAVWRGSNSKFMCFQCFACTVLSQSSNCQRLKFVKMAHATRYQIFIPLIHHLVSCYYTLFMSTFNNSKLIVVVDGSRYQSISIETRNSSHAHAPAPSLCIYSFFKCVHRIPVHSTPCMLLFVKKRRNFKEKKNLICVSQARIEIRILRILIKIVSTCTLFPFIDLSRDTCGLWDWEKLINTLRTHVKKIKYRNIILKIVHLTFNKFKNLFSQCKIYFSYFLVLKFFTYISFGMNDLTCLFYF